jgi:CDP-paratose 2-epimerase
MDVLVTGSSGLIGAEAVQHFDSLGARVWGIDSNMRKEFFGPSGDTTWNLKRLLEITARFTHVDIDIRDRPAIDRLFAEQRFDVVIHCAAQPSHDRAASFPLVDFDVNAVGTINLLEATRIHSPESSFVHLSTNKVYGDAPNERPLKELTMRYEYADPADHDGIDENCRIDQNLHSLFGASKAAGDLVAQEYGRYFGMNVGVFRGGCLTGPGHSGVELHGFLSYLVKCTVHGLPYTIFGYKGKQVRDQIHSADVVRAFEAYAAEPEPAAVYNLGGGRSNSASVLESIDAVERVAGRKLTWSYDDTNRRGDHICYISNLGRLQAAHPGWSVTWSLEDIIEEMVVAERARGS